MIALFIDTGFEEVEALATIDVLRRANVDVKIVSTTGNTLVTGSNKITVKADLLLEEILNEQLKMAILPGGPGHVRLKKNKALLLYIQKAEYIAAICASPTILGMLGILKGKKAVCYPGMEKGLDGAIVCNEDVVVDGNIITSKSAATVFSFAFKLAEILTDVETANNVKQKMCF